ncbi:MAG: hypothetical protein HY360_18285 [Verrucomicrobia bacterium]|nr:hypothetical protein [Verrucomicrobiota bacterium]
MAPFSRDVRLSSVMFATLAALLLPSEHPVVAETKTPVPSGDREIIDGKQKLDGLRLLETWMNGFAS